MADIFSRANDAYGGSFAADGAAVTFPLFGAAGGGGAAGLLAQNMSLNYNQIITKLYELGTRNIYFIGGRSQGVAGMARILGPRPIAVSFYEKFGDVCDADTNNVDIRLRTSGCPTRDAGAPPLAVQQQNEDSVYAVRYSVIQGLGITVAAADVVINEQLQMLFGSLNLRTEQAGNDVIFGP